MKKIVFLFLFITTISLTQNKYEIVNEQILSLVGNEVSFSHKQFNFKLIPIYTENELIDVYYQVSYNESESDFEIKWVDYENGHLINNDSLSALQWKGPFNGLDGTRYKFLFELQRNYNLEFYTKITIFKKSNLGSSNYTRITSPYEVRASYYDASLLTSSLDVYSVFSLIKTVYDIYKGTDLRVALIESVVEEVLEYAIEKSIQNLPVVIELKSKQTNKIYKLEKDNLEDFVFHCPETSRDIKIHFFSKLR